MKTVISCSEALCFNGHNNNKEECNVATRQVGRMKDCADTKTQVIYTPISLSTSDFQGILGTVGAQ